MHAFFFSLHLKSTVWFFDYILVLEKQEHSPCLMIISPIVNSKLLAMSIRKLPENLPLVLDVKCNKVSQEHVG